MQKTVIILLVAILILVSSLTYLFWPQIDGKLETIYSEPTEETEIEFMEEGVEETPAIPQENENTSDLAMLEIHQESQYSTDELLALAKQTVVQDPSQSWIYLEQTLRQDPRNMPARIYRARILESAGKPQLSLEEYEAAYQIRPGDMALVKQFVEFHMRSGNYQKAQNLLSYYQSPPTTESLLIRSWFLDKVVGPKSSIPKDNLSSPFLSYAATIPENSFSNKKTMKELENKNDYLQKEQATYWLALLDTLQKGNEKKALSLLRASPFKSQSWNPQLEIDLQRILQYRINRSLVIDEHSVLFTHLENAEQNLPEWGVKWSEELEAAAEQEMFLPDQAMPIHIRHVLLSDEVFALALLASGWDEAAVNFHRMEIYPSFFPDSASYAMTMALKKNRNKMEAVGFASIQPETPELNLLLGELFLTVGIPSEAIERLSPLAASTNAIAYNASALLAEAYAKIKEYDLAMEVIRKEPRLANSSGGREIMARIALATGDHDKALMLYESIENESSEAKSFLARRAFQEEDWPRAKELTEALIVEFPDNALLKRNLQKINNKLNK